MTATTVTAASATAMRVRVRVVEARLAAMPIRIRSRRASEGISERLVFIFPPARMAQRRLEVLAGSMRTLLDDVCRRTQQRGSVFRGQPLFAEEHIRRPVLLGHPAEL